MHQLIKTLQQSLCSETHGTSCRLIPQSFPQPCSSCWFFFAARPTETRAGASSCVTTGNGPRFWSDPTWSVCSGFTAGSRSASLTAVLQPCSPALAARSRNYVLGVRLDGRLDFFFRVLGLCGNICLSEQGKPAPAFCCFPWVVQPKHESCI